MARKERLSSVDRHLHAAQGSLGYQLPGVITQGVPHFSVRQLPLGLPSSHGGKKQIQLTLAHHLDTIVSLVFHSSSSWWEVCSWLPIFSWNLWEVALFWAFPVGHRLWGGMCGHAETTYSAVGRPSGNIPENISRSIIRGRGTARWLRSKVLAAKADHLRMIPKTQMAEWENQLSKHSLNSVCVPRQAQSYTDTHAWSTICGSVFFWGLPEWFCGHQVMY